MLRFMLDMSRVLAGPWAGQVLADLAPKSSRSNGPAAAMIHGGWGPPYLKDEPDRDTHEAAYFLAANRAAQLREERVGSPIKMPATASMRKRMEEFWEGLKAE